jgi:ATP-dependent helicase HrpB
MLPLPIDAVIPHLLGHLRGDLNLVVEAPPGAGKTTRVPPALLGILSGQVLVLEPRRLAVRLAARRVAWELGESVGETVGYQVRFEEVASRRTRLRYMTEGVLTRRLLSDPNLAGVSAVAIDEFHERHLDGDLALALLRRLQKTARPDLRVVVMSATLEAAPVAEYLGNCRVLRSEGKLYNIAVSYTPHSATPLEEQVAAALETLMGEGLAGDVLVFLPGAAEIRRAARSLEAAARRADLLLVPLHGDLSPEEQDRAVAPGAKTKVILSTNVAESSVTIEGVRAVIDSGLARVASDSPWTGLPVLKVSRISQASARQRAGRAGRTGPGRVIRLYPESDFLRRPDHETPEIARRELSQTLVELRAMGIRSPGDLQWLEPPPQAAVEAAEELLQRLGADRHQREMARYPLHPRLARLVIEASRRGAGGEGCALAAVLSAGERIPPGTQASGPSDLFLLLDAKWEPATARLVKQIQRQWGGSSTRRTAHASDEALLISILTAFPDRVARRRQGNEFLLAAGGSAALAPSSVVRNAQLLVAVDIEERREHGLPVVRLACAIEPEWLLDLFPEHVTEQSTAEWNRAAERVEEVSALLYDGLAIEESRGAPKDLDAAARLLAERALEAGIARFVDSGELAEFLARVSFAAGHSAVKPLGEDDIRAALTELCRGLRSFAELKEKSGGLIRALENDTHILNKIAPESIQLPRGRRVKVHYVRGQAPWIASRLQDFFGMRETPRVAGGKVPLVVHLLAPNQRPVQMTSDLAGFWERLYPQVRRELSRRYPKHKWPEKP